MALPPSIKNLLSFVYCFNIALYRFLFTKLIVYGRDTGFSSFFPYFPKAYCSFHITFANRQSTIVSTPSMAVISCIAAIIHIQ